MQRKLGSDKLLQRFIEPHKLSTKQKRLTRNVVLKPGDPPGRVPGRHMHGGYVDEMSHGPPADV